MGLDNQVKHLLHCCTMIAVVFSIIYFLSIIADPGKRVPEPLTFNSPNFHQFVFRLGLLSLRIVVLFALPQTVLNFLGLLCFNAFPNQVKLKGSSLLTPMICVRIVTRGDYPQLVRDNVIKNLARCSEAGIDNILIEVVTDKAIGLPIHRSIREIVIPSTYRSKNGSLYKARALQYCLEDGVNLLHDDDYIVHLDEETIMTENSIRGIINFVLDGKYDFGQGLITYANDKVMNWVTTLADSIRVADDMGKLRAQFRFFNKPLLNWKGSFIVARVGAERNVTYDNGASGSIAEDCYFAMKAIMKNYTFQFVDGEMWEKSPFTVWDFIQQRKRWLQGIYLVVHAPEICWKTKIWLACSLYAWMSMPLGLTNVVLSFIFPIDVPIWINILCSFVAAVDIYMYFYGTVKSLSLYRLGYLKYVSCLSCLAFIIIFSLVLENVAVILAVCSSKKKFVVINKDVRSTINDSKLNHVSNYGSVED